MAYDIFLIDAIESASGEVSWAHWEAHNLMEDPTP